MIVILSFQKKRKGGKCGHKIKKNFLMERALGKCKFYCRDLRGNTDDKSKQG